MPVYADLKEKRVKERGEQWSDTKKRKAGLKEPGRLLNSILAPESDC